ncbi:MAG: diphosphomevalonate decarboxylase [Saprospiraceae bacterium]
MLNYHNPDLVLTDLTVTAGNIHWKSPSNLAIIKYWGKYGQQLPRNPSISFTLQNAYTETAFSYQAKSVASDDIMLDFYFEGKPNEAFKAKLVKFLHSIRPIFPFLSQFELTIKSSNSFPHSAGIASSASSMSALALCLCSMEKALFGNLSTEQAFLQKASFVARLGSGSACRSVYPTMAIWGENDVEADASNLYATSFVEDLHPIFKSFHDDILIASKAEKSVSSRAGHALMENNIYAENRYAQARQRFRELLNALRSGDVEQFGSIAENEALSLHALMMTSNPSYILMRPNSLKMIEMVRQYRADTKRALYFSLDAGPNLHLLYPDDITTEVQQFIKEELSPYCEDGLWIPDVVGQGPVNKTS